ncbi:OLC1v1035493C1 [Oldenlandia corymbosa var. corymbosa]|uniref:OLC1v1035493C1 n=1 Tax=Oldenlandia corymbosa var. corymbosa TaxID=529605 RepID=A0AAV1CT60_OLDCO|nr:OLC1v1035493C1 [Oldenlandia corymbosa var. corymbosa]
MSFRDMLNQNRPHLEISSDDEDGGDLNDDVTIDFGSVEPDVEIKDKFYKSLIKSWQNACPDRPRDDGMSQVNHNAGLVVNESEKRNQDGDNVVTGVHNNVVAQDQGEERVFGIWLVAKTPAHNKQARNEEENMSQHNCASAKNGEPVRFHVGKEKKGNNMGQMRENQRSGRKGKTDEWNIVTDSKWMHFL